VVSEESAVHPGPTSAVLPARIARELLAHARREDPNEMCGLILGTAPAAAGGQALSFRATRNAAASPYRYEIDSKDLLRLTIESDDRDEVFWAIVHSHTHTQARPSPTDIGLAFYPDALYILVSLAEDAGSGDPAGAAEGPSTGPAGLSPQIRAWRIVERRVFEVSLVLA
jgi:proteasome lid subunit RPN8/RPN11